ncbi:unnamed protein product [Durusdinium trenchii]|uniref:Uncharacterized protein n=1 Tax=Durusdinium trenchii TaxID=1381693 RepID=A0ABP0PN75_9DINO
MAPFSTGYVKGWRRSLTALVVADGIRSLDLYSELTENFKKSMSVIYGTVAHFSTLRDVVHCNRGISMAAAATRKAPNAFMFCRQLDVLRKAGDDQEWGSAAAIMKAFRIGKHESGAIANLQKHMAREVSEGLKDAVRIRGMKQFVLHETISREIFNSAFTSGTGVLEQWAVQLTNTEPNELALLLIERMKADWDRSSVRKPWGVKETTHLHSMCGAFIHFRSMFEAKVSSEEYAKHSQSLHSNFLQGFLDADLEHGLLTTVPPGDVTNIGFLRTIVQDSEKRIALELEEKEQELAERIANATLDSLKLKIDVDLAALRKAAPSPENDAIQAALDCKRGQSWVKTWMEERFQLILQPDGNMSQVLGQFAKFSAEVCKGGDQAHTLILVDATVYPANAQYFNQALQSMATVLHFGGHCIAHCQLPVMQSNTTSKALLNHRRSMEDMFVNNNLDVTVPVTLHFQKPADTSNNDKRRLSQLCLAVSSDSEKLMWSVPPVISQIPLVKVQDMRGFDDGSKPGPTARAEQKGVLAHEKILAAYLNGVTWPRNSKVLIFDMVPNRQAEFGRAALDRALATNQVPKVHYMGIMRPDMKSVVGELEQQIYKWWDESDESGPKQRPRTEQERPALTILRWAGSVPKLPDQVLGSFPVGSPQHNEILKLEQELKAVWPSQPQPERDSPAAPVRTSALPDLTGARVLDVTREISAAHISAVCFDVQRLAFCQGKSGKPSILISKELDIYLGNLENTEIVCPAGELFGFFTGAFESKIVKGAVAAALGCLGEREVNSIPWRLESDTTLVSHNKKLMMVCQYVCQLAREDGLGEVQLEDHDMKPKMRAPEAT